MSPRYLNQPLKEQRQRQPEQQQQDQQQQRRQPVLVWTNMPSSAPNRPHLALHTDIPRSKPRAHELREHSTPLPRSTTYATKQYRLSAQHPQPCPLPQAHPQHSTPTAQHTDAPAPRACLVARRLYPVGDTRQSNEPTNLLIYQPTNHRRRLHENLPNNPNHPPTSVSAAPFPRRTSTTPTKWSVVAGWGRTRRVRFFGPFDYPTLVSRRPRS